MRKFVQQAARARGALAVDPKTLEGTSFPERFCAWDEDRTTLALDATSALGRGRGLSSGTPPRADARGPSPEGDAARTLPRAPVAFVGPGIDVETLRVALDVPTLHQASDPMALAKSVAGPALAIGCPDDHTALAALVVEGDGTDPAAPRDVSSPPRMVSALRALQEMRAVPPAERHPDTPMGAYVPWGTWNEDLPARLRLLAQRCTACGRTMYPPRAACPECRERAIEPVPLPEEARVYTMTRIGRGGAPNEFALEQTQVGAYWVALVEWPEHAVKVIARLSGYDEEGPRIGDRVRPVIRRLFEQEGRVRYGTKFIRFA